MMPNFTDVFAFIYELASDQPGISVTGGEFDTWPILAEQVEAVLLQLQTRIDSQNQIPTQQIFTSGGTWTKPANLNYITVEVQAAGGAGGGADNTDPTQWDAGGGGGGGAYARSLIPAASLPAGVSVTVGAGPVGLPATAGGDGGDSSFGSLVTAEGGGGGGKESPAVGEQNVPGGTGGISGVGDVVLRGGDGGNAGTIASSMVIQQAYGGVSFLGTSPRVAATTGGAHGFDGHLYGGGGSGAFNDTDELEEKTGGDGADGIVIVTEYYGG